MLGNLANTRSRVFNVFVIVFLDADVDNNTYRSFSEFIRGRKSGKTWLARSSNGRCSWIVSIDQ